jgi:hypothetical protein
LAFSSARRRLATSQSKMPPQQRQRLSDVVDDRLRFSAHLPSSCGVRFLVLAPHRPGPNLGASSPCINSLSAMTERGQTACGMTT